MSTGQTRIEGEEETTLRVYVVYPNIVVLDEDFAILRGREWEIGFVL